MNSDERIDYLQALGGSPNTRRRAGHQDFIEEDAKADTHEDDFRDDASGLSIISRESTYFESKVGYQRRALLRKNLMLQWRQKLTNIIQLSTPLIGLTIIVVLKGLGANTLEKYADHQVYMPVPQLFQLNYYPLSYVGDLFTVTTCNQWYMYQFDNTCSDECQKYWGENHGTPQNRPSSYGMIGNKNVLTYSCPVVNKTVPYFAELNNETINEYLYDVLDHMHDSNMTFTDKNKEIDYLDQYPDGAFRIRQASDSSLSYNLQVEDARYWQYHRDNGITKIGIIDSSNNYTEYQIYKNIDGQINVANLINTAYIKQLFNTTVISGVSPFPFVAGFEKELDRGVSLIGMMVYPMCLSLCIPMFLFTIVMEKETRLIETMKSNGLRMVNYWIVFFFFSLAFYALQIALFVLYGGPILGFQIISETASPILFAIFLGWGLCQISLAVFFSSFVSKAQSASIIGYGVAIWVTLIASTINISIYQYPNHMEFWFQMFPTFSFCRAFYHVSRMCAFETCPGSFSQIPGEGTLSIILLYVHAIVYMSLGIYLHQVVPQQYGTSKHPCFCLKKKKNSSVNREVDDIEDLENVRENKEVPIFDFDLTLEDSDSKAQRNIVYNLDKSEYYKYPLIVKDLRKVYPGFGGRQPKVATKCFSLMIKKGEFFGMLGPNGAGKTTLISQLTGLYPPNQGNAWVAGYDIRNQLELVQLQIGVCPQFDVLWPDLTVKEHLLFYARLKGIPPEEEQAKAEQALSEVMLERFRHFKTRELSGGMKRRLSVAISLVSDPKIIYLDEPTTGLDPENRRQLWNILASFKGKRAIILTTHSMEEADILCDRIGIVADGILRCVAPQVRLKNLYGGGYQLFLNTFKQKFLSIQLKEEKKRKKEKNDGVEIRVMKDPRYSLGNDSIIQEEEKETQAWDDEIFDFKTGKANMDLVFVRVKDFVKHLLPKAYILREFNGSFVYQVPCEGFEAEKLFIEMEKNKDRLKISDWGISQCSLEDVFQKICVP